MSQWTAPVLDCSKSTDLIRIVTINQLTRNQKQFSINSNGLSNTCIICNYHLTNFVLFGTRLQVRSAQNAATVFYNTNRYCLLKNFVWLIRPKKLWDDRSCGVNIFFKTSNMAQILSGEDISQGLCFRRERFLRVTLKIKRLFVRYKTGNSRCSTSREAEDSDTKCWLYF